MHPSHSHTPDVAATIGHLTAPRRRVLKLAATLLVCIGLFGLASAQAQAAPLWGPATPAIFEDGVQASTPYAVLNDVSCATVDNCTAVGEFLDVDGNLRAFAQTLTDGVWGSGVPAVFAVGVEYANSNAHLTAVSCASAGNCTAVGRFKDAAGYYEAFLVTQTDGDWGLAVPVVFPAEHAQNVQPDADLTSVSCTGEDAGNCTAVGGFTNAAGYYEAFAVTQIDGTWGVAVPTTFSVEHPQHPQPIDRLISVSCVSPGNCTAVGRLKHDYRGDDAFAQTQIDGVWGDAIPVEFADGVMDYYYGGAEATSVSCTGEEAGNCTVVGSYYDSPEIHPFMSTQTTGSWSQAEVPTLPGGGPILGPLAAVSCWGVGDCAAVGHEGDAFAVVQTGGVWGETVLATLPDGVGSEVPYQEMRDMSCASAGNCTAVGIFRNRETGYAPFAWTQTDGVWGEGVPSSFAEGTHAAGSDADDSFTSVSCASAGNCVGVGSFVNTNYGYEAFAQTQTSDAETPVSSGPGGVRDVVPAVPSMAPSVVSDVFSPAPGITVGATRGAVTLAASVRASCRDLVRGANIWVRSTSRVMCVQRSLPAGLSLQHGRLVSATPGTYPVEVRIKRANGTTLTRTITVTVR